MNKKWCEAHKQDGEKVIAEFKAQYSTGAWSYVCEAHARSWNLGADKKYRVIKLSKAEGGHHA